MTARYLTHIHGGRMRRCMAAILFLFALPFAAQAAGNGTALKIATIGAGNIGGTIGGLFAQAGHQVFFSSRHPEELQPLVKKYSPNARAGTVEEAIQFADVILLAVPYKAMPQISKDYGRALAGKIVLDAGNPIPARDGPMAEEALKKGTGVATAEYLPGARIVRAFSSESYRVFASEAHRPAPRLAVPLAGDDQEALAVAAHLVRDAGFEPVIVGDLNKGREFDFRSKLFVKPMTAKELREALNLK
jgi:predicted dinucleotide-binding enzyme